MSTERRPLVNASVEVDEADGRMVLEKALADGLYRGTSDLHHCEVLTFAAAGVQTLLVAQAGKKIGLRFWKVSVDAAMRVDLEDGAGNDLDVMYLPATGQGGGSAPLSPLLMETAGGGLCVRASAAGNVAATLVGYYW